MPSIKGSLAHPRKNCSCGAVGWGGTPVRDGEVRKEVAPVLLERHQDGAEASAGRLEKGFHAQRLAEWICQEVLQLLWRCYRGDDNLNRIYSKARQPTGRPCNVAGK